MDTPIVPKIIFNICCPKCQTTILKHFGIIWQGIHICTDSLCPSCEQEYLCDLPAGQGLVTPYVLNKKTGDIVNNDPDNWFTTSLKQIIKSPKDESISLKVEKFKEYKKVVVLNTLDFIYGHCIARLFNAGEYLESGSDYGLIVIIQPALRWLVPEGVAEIWTVSLPLNEAMNYFSQLNLTINNEISRFNEASLSSAYIYPNGLNITRFTRIPVHDFKAKQFRITYIWREDARRLWHKRTLLTRGMKKMSMVSLIQFWQFIKVVYLFRQMKKKIPDAKYSVVGLGKLGKFPSWIADHRIKAFNESTESKLCDIYSQSRIIIGVVGSHMILPSAHAGMVIDLMPQKWWGALSQDLIYQENDVRIAVFQKRILPIEVSIKELVDICEHMLSFRKGYLKRMIEPFQGSEKS